MKRRGEGCKSGGDDGNDSQDLYMDEGMKELRVCEICFLKSTSRVQVHMDFDKIPTQKEYHTDTMQSRSHFYLKAKLLQNTTNGRKEFESFRMYCKYYIENMNPKLSFLLNKHNVK